MFVFGSRDEADGDAADDATSDDADDYAGFSLKCEYAIGSDCVGGIGDVPTGQHNDVGSDTDSQRGNMTTITMTTTNKRIGGKRIGGWRIELYRIINKKLDPNNSISEHIILADIRRLALAKAKDLNETRTQVVQLVALCNEYCKKTGKEVELSEKTFAIWMFMDDDSKGKGLRNKTLLKATLPLHRCATTLKPSALKRATGRPLQIMLRLRLR